MNISACIITKNESENIEKCIVSLKKIANEIILVDTGSTDSTIQIAEELGAIIYKYKWNNDFSEAKNYALDQAKGDWIIFLDADEYFKDNSVNKLTDIIKNLDRKFDGIICTMINIHTDEKTVIDQIPILRIFRNKKYLRYKNKIHERLCINASDDQILCEYVPDIIINHTGYSPEKIKNKVNRNFDLLEELIKNDEKDFYIYYYFATTYFMWKDYEKAYFYTSEFIKYDTRNIKANEVDLCFKIYPIRIESMIKLGYEKDELLKELNKIKPMQENHPEIKLCEAMIYYENNCLEIGMEKFKEAVDLHINYNGFTENSFSSKHANVLYRIGEINQIKGNYSECFDYYLQALQKNRKHLASFLGLIYLIKNETDEDKIEFIKSLFDCNDVDDLEFIVKSLNLSKEKVPLLYFFNIYYSKKKDVDNSIIINVMLLDDQHSSALDAASFLYETNKNEAFGFKLAFVLIYGNHANWYFENKNKLYPHYKGVLEAYFENKIDSDFLKNNLKQFLTVTDELIKFDNKKIIEMFLSKFSSILNEINDYIGDLYLKNKDFATAIKYFEMSDYDDNKLNKIAVCKFQTNDYDKSEEIFKLLMNKGYQVNSSRDYLKWISEKSGNL